MSATAKFIISAAVFSQVLKEVKPLVANSPVIPVLGDILVQVSAGILTVTAHDLETTIRVKRPVEATGDFIFSVGFKTLYNLFSKVPDQPASFSYEDETKKTTITLDRGTVAVTGEDVQDWPEIPETEGEYTSIPFELLQKATDLAPFLSKDELRPAMTGLYLELGPKFRAAATNGHLLLRIEQDGITEEEIKFILPGKTTNILKAFKTKACTAFVRLHRKIGEYKGAVTKGAPFLEIVLGDTTFIVKVVDERYPDYENVIPKNSQYSIKVDVSDLASALKFAQLTANKHTQQVIFSFKEGKGVLSAKNLDDDSESTSTFQIAGGFLPDPDFRIGFNAGLLLQVLGSYSGQVEFSLTNPNRAVVITQAQNPLLGLLMPIMIGQYV